MKKNLTELVFILDRSGSMQGLEGDTIGGFNAMIEQQKKEGCFMKKNLTELVFILDRSGSMQGLEGDTIGGFNAMIEQQKKEPGEALVSTVLFDDQTEVLHDRVKLGEVRPITEKEYDVGGWRSGPSRKRSTMSGAAPPCWMLLAGPSTTSATSTSMPGARMYRSTPCSSSPPTAWKTPAAATRPRR